MIVLATNLWGLCSHQFSFLAGSHFRQRLAPNGDRAPGCRESLVSVS